MKLVTTVRAWKEMFMDEFQLQERYDDDFAFLKRNKCDIGFRTYHFVPAIDRTIESRIISEDFSRIGWHFIDGRGYIM